MVSAMLTTIRAKFSNGPLVPLEPVEIEEGRVLFVTLDIKPNIPYEERLKRFRSASGGWKGSHDPDELTRMLYEARRAGSREAQDS